MNQRILLLAVLVSGFYSGTDLRCAAPCRDLPFEVVAEGFAFPEGPAFDDQGNLYVVAYKRTEDIGRITPEGSVEVFLDLSPQNSAVNGMAFSPDGRLFACEYQNSRIVAIDLATRKLSVVVDSYDGQPLNKPNDIFLCANGDLFFTDPYREDPTIGGRVFVYSLKERKLYLLLDGLAFPNGLTVSADRKTLYVASTVRRSVTAYPLSADGHSASQGKEVFLMAGGEGPDGIEFDERGNLFVAHYGAGKLYMLGPDFKLKACATGFGDNPTNVQIRGDWIYVTEAKLGRVLRIRRDLFYQGN